MRSFLAGNGTDSTAAVLAFLKNPTRNELDVADLYLIGDIDALASGGVGGGGGGGGGGTPPVFVAGGHSYAGNMYAGEAIPWPSGNFVFGHVTGPQISIWNAVAAAYMRCIYNPIEATPAAVCPTAGGAGQPDPTILAIAQSALESLVAWNCVHQGPGVDIPANVPPCAQQAGGTYNPCSPYTGSPAIAGNIRSDSTPGGAPNWKMEATGFNIVGGSLIDQATTSGVSGSNVGSLTLDGVTFPAYNGNPLLGSNLVDASGWVLWMGKFIGPSGIPLFVLVGCGVQTLGGVAGAAPGWTSVYSTTGPTGTGNVQILVQTGSAPPSPTPGSGAGIPGPVLLTNWPSPLEWRVYGTFLPTTIKRGKVSSKVGLEVATLDVEWSPKLTAFGTTVMTMNPYQLAQTGFYDNKAFRLWRTLMPTPGDADTFGATSWFGGRIASAKVSRGTITFTVNSFLDAINQKVPANVIELSNAMSQYVGNTPVLADGETNVPIFTVVAPSSATQITGDCLQPSPHKIYSFNKFFQGFMVFLPGSTLAGYWSPVAQNSQVTYGSNYNGFTVYAAFPFAPTPGDKFYVSTQWPINLAAATAGQYKGFPGVPSPLQAI